jgi:hypothetical protein
MRQRARWLRRLGIVLPAALCLACGQGCLPLAGVTAVLLRPEVVGGVGGAAGAPLVCLGRPGRFVHPLDLPPKEQVVLGEKIPAPSRNHVHIFLMHGLDPLDVANLYGLTEYIQQLGYIKTHCGQLYHFWSFKNEMCRLHKEEPQTRFVVIGFSFGAEAACHLVDAVKKDGIVVDLLIYLGGYTLGNTPRAQPENASRIVNILTAGCPWDGNMARADNIQFYDVWHFGPPTHAQTRKLLARELAVVAERVPYVEKVPPLPLELEEEIPRPRRVSQEQLRELSSQLPPEWGFLNSRSARGEPPPPRLAKPTENPNAKRVPFAIVP